MKTNTTSIVFVEDDDDSRLVYTMLLENSGYIVRGFADGESALESVTNQPPDAVLLDIGLPGRSGLEVATDIRKSEACSGIVLIALTGSNQIVDRNEIASAGFDAHLVKPARFALISATIEEQLAKQKESP